MKPEKRLTCGGHVEQTLLVHTMGTSIAAVRKISEYCPNLEARDSGENTVFTLITRKTTVEAVRLPLRYGARLDVVDKHREKTPLILALSTENLDVAEFLPDEGRREVNYPQAECLWNTTASCVYLQQPRGCPSSP